MSEVTGVGLVLDEETGYLTPLVQEVTGSGLASYRFDAKKKSEFVAVLRTVPHIRKACRGVGITPQTFYNHYKIDAKFKADVNESIQERCDDLEEVMIKQGMQKSGFLDRIAYLKAHRPETYDRARRVIVEGRKMGADEAEKRRQRLDGAIDAEVVRAVKQETKLGGSRLELEQGKAGGGAVGGGGQ